jgi:hypothetical protein
MKKLTTYLLAGALVVLLAEAAVMAQAGILETDQQALRTQYIGKVLIFRSSSRLASTLELNEDGMLKGKHKPGYWTVDGAVQVKDVDFRKDRITFKCAKLWHNHKDDGQLHYFPASAALKGKTDYTENSEISFRTKGDGESLADFNQRVNKVFLGEEDSKLSSTPAPIAAYIQKLSPQVDFDPASAMGGFDGTPPKALSTPKPELTREASLVGQSGKESFVLLVDEQGSAAVVGFTHPLQFGLEEATIEAVKTWKFAPAMKDGKPVALRIPMTIEFSKPGLK